jgi:hypothetical protein
VGVEVTPDSGDGRGVGENRFDQAHARGFRVERSGDRA